MERQEDISVETPKMSGVLLFINSDKRAAAKIGVKKSFHAPMPPMQAMTLEEKE